MRFIQNDRSEGEFLEFLQIAPQQRIIGHNQIVLGDLLPQIVPRGAAFEHQHLHLGREAVGFAAPIVQHRGRTNDQGGLGLFAVAIPQPGQPGQSLQRLAQAHVVGERASEVHLSEVTEKIESFLLVRPQFGLDPRRQRNLWNALKPG